MYEGRGWWLQSDVTCCSYYNSRGLSIAFIGDYWHTSPSLAMLKAVDDLITCGLYRVGIHFLYFLYLGQKYLYSYYKWLFSDL